MGVFVSTGTNSKSDEDAYVVVPDRSKVKSNTDACVVVENDVDWDVIEKDEKMESSNEKGNNKTSGTNRVTLEIGLENSQFKSEPIFKFVDFYVRYGVMKPIT
jgi:GTP-dependent phosphoenolpyruvate carboxykinase